MLSPIFLVILIAILVTAMVMGLIAELKAIQRAKSPAPLNMPPRGGEPDYPAEPHRWREWVCVPSEDHRKIAQVLNLSDSQYSNWRNGLKWGRDSKAFTLNKRLCSCFVSPSVNGWVFIFIGGDMVKADQAWPVLEVLSEAFGEAQYFCRYMGAAERNLPVFFGWDRARSGTVVRSFRYALDRICQQVGAPTSVEVRMFNETTKGWGKGWDGRWADGDEALPVSLFEEAISGEDAENLPYLVAEDWGLSPLAITEEAQGRPRYGLAGFLDKACLEANPVKRPSDPQST